MDNNEIMIEFDKVFENEAFVQELADATSAAELKRLLSLKDIRVSEEGAEEIFSQILRIKNGGELSEEELDQVGGGWVGFGIGVIAVGTFYIVYKIGKKIVDSKCK